jgi:hypothetical protein
LRQPAGDLTIPVAGDADVPVAGDEDLAEGLGGEGHEARLHAEHDAAGVIAAPERGARDGLLGHRLEPLRHVHLHLAAGGGGHRPPPLRQRRHRPADVRRQPLRTEGRTRHVSVSRDHWLPTAIGLKATGGGDRAACAYVEVVGEEGRGEDAAVERPLVVVEADEAVALELPDHGVRLVAVERVRARQEDLPDQLRVRHRQPRRRPEPYQEHRPCTAVTTNEQPLISSPELDKSIDDDSDKNNRTWQRRVP